MSRNRMSGFTLIELMVVIVIIGVLASLAIPRFTEASMKAKVQDGPKVLANYETSFLAAVAERGFDKDLTEEHMMFKIPNNNWYDYKYDGTKAGEGGTADGQKGKVDALTATGAKGVKITLKSTYQDSPNAFDRTCSGTDIGKQGDYVGNFIDAASGTGTKCKKE